MTSQAERNNRNHGMSEVLLMLLLLSAFAVSALIIVMIGANAYQSISMDKAYNAEVRIPFSYITNKVHQSDRSDAVKLLDFDGTRVLILSSTESDATYDTWIYVYEGQLREVTVAAGTDLALADGIAVMPVHDFQMRLDGQRMLVLTSQDASGRALSVSVALRSEIREVSE